MKIISGGQTGADVAGLDAAIKLGLEYGGSLPKGRLTERGPLPARYDRMVELESPSYPKRTLKNVLDSDATIIFTLGRIGGGSSLTLGFAKKRQKPYLHVDLEAQSGVQAAQMIRSWLDKINPKILNVAGSRESKVTGIYGKVLRVLVAALKG